MTVAALSGFPRHVVVANYIKDLRSQYTREDVALQAAINEKSARLTEIHQLKEQEVQQKLEEIDYQTKKDALTRALAELEDQRRHFDENVEEKYDQDEVIRDIRTLKSKKEKLQESIEQQMDKYDTWRDCVSVIVELPEGETMLYGLPECFISKLFPFQIASIHRMLQVSSFSACGVLGNQVGSGKTRTALIFAVLFAIQRNQKVLIVVPSRMIHHWMGEVTKLNTATHKFDAYTEYYRDIRDVKNKFSHSTKNVHIMTLSLFHNHLRTLPTREAYGMVICDEMNTCMMLHKQYRQIPGTFAKEWILSATMSTSDSALCQEEVKEHCRHFPGPNVWAHFTGDCMVRCSADFIKSSFEIPALRKMIVHCKGVAEEIRSLIPRSIINLINQGCMAEAIERAGGSNTSTNIAVALTEGYRNNEMACRNNVQRFEEQLDIVHNDTSRETDAYQAIFTEHYNDRSHFCLRAVLEDNIAYESKRADDFKKKRTMIEERLAETFCPICVTDDSEVPSAITTCCQRRMCFECLILWLEQKSSCPVCRAAMDQNKFHVVRAATDNSETNQIVPRTDTNFTKHENLMHIITREKANKILVFSDNSDTFSVMRSLKAKGITCEVLHGTSARARNLITAHQKGHIDILFLNRKICGEGWHLAYSNTIIFFHTLAHQYHYIQAIARANRFPRATPLNVYHLLANDETLGALNATTDQ